MMIEDLHNGNIYSSQTMNRASESFIPRSHTHIMDQPRTEAKNDSELGSECVDYIGGGVTSSVYNGKDSAIWTMSNSSSDPTSTRKTKQEQRKYLSLTRANNLKGSSVVSSGSVNEDGKVKVLKRNYGLGDSVKHIDIGGEDSNVMHIPGLSETLSKLHISSQNPKKKKKSTKNTESELDLTTLENRMSRLPPHEREEMFYTQDEDNDNLLMLAIIQQSVPLAVALIHTVPSPSLLDMHNKLRQTALHLAVITKQFNIVRELVIKGANLTVIDRNGNTPLHIACSHDNMNCVVALTKVVTPLECPTQFRRQLCVPQPHNLFNNNGQTCAHIAAVNGNTDLVKYLVETRYKADVNVQERLSGKNLLHIASECGNMEMVSYLLSNDRLNLSALTYSLHNALDLAIGRRQNLIVDMLFAASASECHDDTEASDNSDEEDEKEEELTLRDFQCNAYIRGTRVADESDYDDFC